MRLASVSSVGTGSAPVPIGAEDIAPQDPTRLPGGVLAKVRAASLTVAPTVLVLAMSAGQSMDPGAPWPMIVLLAQALPLLLLRRAPRLVLAFVAGVTAAQLAGGLPPSNGVVAQAVAVAVVVARTSWPTSVVVPLLVLATSAAGATAGHVRGLASFLVVTGMSLVLAWFLGDAAGRRVDVRGAMEEQLARREQRHRLQARVVVLSERLRIARELHDLAGEALDAVVVQVGAARARLGDPVGPDVIAGIESPAREALAELDRFLDLLRREGTGLDKGQQGPQSHLMPEPVGEGRGGPWLGVRAPGVGLVGAALGVGLLIAVDISGLPSRAGLPQWWPAVLCCAVVALLLLRRRFPQAVTAVLVLVLGAHLAAGAPVDYALLAVPVAVHQVAACGPRRRAITAGASAVLVLACAAASAEPSSGIRALGVLGVLSAVALYAGDSVRVAGAHNAMLLQRIAEIEAAEQLQQRAVVAEERTRAARDLHDSLGHTLSLIIVQAGAARLAAASRTPEGLARAEEVLTAVERSARSALTALDTTLADVSRAAAGPGPVLPGAGDVPAMVEGVRHAGSRVTVRMESIDDLPRSLQAAVFRVVQEALTNVVKHAPGAATTVDVRRRGDVLDVVVRNGAGSRRGPGLPSGRRGLAGMAERLTMFGGDLRASPDGHGGYVLHATMRMPLPVEPGGTRSPSPLVEPAPAVGRDADGRQR